MLSRSYLELRILNYYDLPYQISTWIMKHNRVLLVLVCCCRRTLDMNNGEGICGTRRLLPWIWAAGGSCNEIIKTMPIELLMGVKSCVILQSIQKLYPCVKSTQSCELLRIPSWIINILKKIILEFAIAELFATLGNLDSTCCCCSDC